MKVTQEWTVRLKTTYKNDVKDGPQEYYFENGQLRYKATYKNDNEDGPYESYKRMVS